VPPQANAPTTSHPTTIVLELSAGSELVTFEDARPTCRTHARKTDYNVQTIIPQRKLLVNASTREKHNSPLATESRPKSLRQSWDYFEQVTDNPVLRHVEDGCIFVLVDGDDDFGVAHAGKMLDSTRDTAGNI
jgi:hypothetical protein